VVVNGYLDVDLEIVHSSLNDQFDDFAEFARHVGRYLDNPTEP
jgi:uncharacterized protein YutE (UPF0331/DUF86 family)